MEELNRLWLPRYASEPIRNVVHGQGLVLYKLERMEEALEKFRYIVESARDKDEPPTQHTVCGRPKVRQFAASSVFCLSKRIRNSTPSGVNCSGFSIAAMSCNNPSFPCT